MGAMTPRSPSRRAKRDNMAQCVSYIGFYDAKVAISSRYARLDDLGETMSIVYFNTICSDATCSDYTHSRHVRPAPTLSSSLLFLRNSRLRRFAPCTSARLLFSLRAAKKQTHIRAAQGCSRVYLLGCCLGLGCRSSMSRACILCLTFHYILL